MVEVNLYTRDDRLVARVLVPAVRPEGVAWGSRTFFRRPDGVYFEGLLWQAVTREQAEIEQREGTRG